MRDTLTSHYSHPGLLSRIDEVLRAEGKDLSSLSVDDLAGVDQFHVGGRAATLSIANKAGLRAGDRVLDVGGGLGGPARLLAKNMGCHVTVLDLTEEFCDVGRELTRRCGLEDQVHFVCGNALEPPFESETFDVVWSQHSSMNIPQKDQLHREMARVLRPGGKYVIHEAFSGEVEPVLYPTPWASDSNTSFMISAGECRALLTNAGFREEFWQDTTEASTKWVLGRTQSKPSGNGVFLGIHLILGDVFKPAFSNLLRNLQEGRLHIVEAVLVR